MMNQDYMSKLVARALDEEFTEELTEELTEVKSTIEYKPIVGDNKAKLPFKGARWVPLPREFSGKLGILNQGLEVSDAGVICTQNGLIKANINTREKWKALDHLPGKAEFKSETQGEEPSRTFKVSGPFVHPKIDEEAASGATSLINTRIVVLVEDMRGKFRVIGCEQYDGALVSPSRDNGQGATGTAGTTIAVEAYDPVDAPFYSGPIVTEDGTINEAPGAVSPGIGQ